VLLAETLDDWLAGRVPPVPQDAAQASYAPRLEKDEGRIDWRRDPIEIDRRVRALYAWPGAVTTLDGEALKLHAVQPLDLMPAAAPGTVVQADARRGVHVACGGGTLELVDVQLAGRPRLPARDLVSGRRLQAGTRLGS
jgi:methionyl-tRNA formyltransferase